MSAPRPHPPPGWGSPSAWPAKVAFYLRHRGDRLRRRCYIAVQDFRHRGLARFTVLWESPPVVLAAHTGVERLAPLPSGSLLLVALYQSHEVPAVRAATAARLRAAFPPDSGVRVVVLANTPREAALLGADGFEAEFVNHNAFVDEREFVILAGASKRYDAIYDAQVLPFKRHALASGIASLALVSYVNRPSPDMAYARGIRRLLAGATWLNDPLGPGARRLALSEVCAACNAARVGLCLSETEGAMYASCQYLLCGLPVVSTPNIGGRDVFFEEDFALTVPPDPEAVAAGVREMAGRRVDPASIRSRTLARMEEMRGRFVALVQGHLDASGSGGDFAGRFRSAFFHTLMKDRRVSTERPGRG